MVWCKPVRLFVAPPIAPDQSMIRLSCPARVFEFGRDRPGQSDCPTQSMIQYPFRPQWRPDTYSVSHSYIHNQMIPVIRGIRWMSSSANDASDDYLWAPDLI